MTDTDLKVIAALAITYARTIFCELAIFGELRVQLSEDLLEKEMPSSNRPERLATSYPDSTINPRRYLASAFGSCSVIV
jgi:hypothetical protein